MANNFEKNVNNFINELANFQDMDNVFNPWKDYDEKHDKDTNSHILRCDNLKKYLLARENAKYILIAEAPGYQGCHFSGIPMTSERLILTDRYELGNLKRTSDENKLSKAKIYTPNFPNGKNIAKTVIKNGFKEPTATIVWKQMVDILKLKPTDFVLWNAFPFHPYKNEYGYLSNRKPDDNGDNNELIRTQNILNKFLNMFPKENSERKYICIGNVAENTLKNIYEKDSFKKVRHPANGGAEKFRKKILEIKNMLNK